MPGKYKVITLCGSARFKDAFVRVQRELTLEGSIVISLGFFADEGEDALSQDVKNMLDDMHRCRIDMADEIFVVNVDGYIGKSTKGEIEYALRAGKRVRYLAEPQA